VLSLHILDLMSWKRKGYKGIKLCTWFLKCPLYPPNATKESSTTATLKPCPCHGKQCNFLEIDTLVYLHLFTTESKRAMYHIKQWRCSEMHY
jgi:hypothetical protein